MFTDLMQTADLILLDQFSDKVQVTIHVITPTGIQDVIVPAIVKNPALEEDYVPAAPFANSADPGGVGSILLFIRYTADTGMIRGSTATVTNSSQFAGDYDIWQVDVDRVGGASLRMRKRMVAWDA